MSDASTRTDDSTEISAVEIDSNNSQVINVITESYMPVQVVGYI